MDGCFQKEFFLSIKKRRGSKLVHSLPPPHFFSVCYVKGKQTVTKDDKLVAWGGGDLVLRLVFFLAYIAFSLKRLNSNQHFKNGSSNLERKFPESLEE